MPAKKIDHECWGKVNLDEFYKSINRFVKSLKTPGNPDHSALVDAHRHIYGAEINFRDAGIKAKNDGGITYGWHDSEKTRKTIERLLLELLLCNSKRDVIEISRRYFT